MGCKRSACIAEECTVKAMCFFRESSFSLLEGLSMNVCDLFWAFFILCFLQRTQKKSMVFHIANGPVVWIQHPFVFILVGFLVFLFFGIFCNSKSLLFFPALAKTSRDPTGKEIMNVFSRPHFLNTGGYLIWSPNDRVWKLTINIDNLLCLPTKRHYWLR